jgi:hypothetical protein
MTSRILPALALLLAVGIFFGYVSPTWNGPIAQTKTGIQNDRDALAAAKEFTARQNELAGQKNAMDPAQVARLESFLPDSVNNVGLILDLNALAARTGLSLSNIDVGGDSGDAGAEGSVAGAAPVGSVDLTLSAVGTYAALQEFLKGVEFSLRMLDEQDLVIKGSETGVYTYQMRLRFYWLR